MIKRMFHQILFSSLALLPMFALGLGSAASYAAGKHPIDLFRGERHPTEVEFREEMRAADVIICGRVQEICRIEEGGFHPEVVARIDVRRTYKGELPDTNPCIRMEIVGASRLIMGDHGGGGHLRPYTPLAWHRRRSDLADLSGSTACPSMFRRLVRGFITWCRSSTVSVLMAE